MTAIAAKTPKSLLKATDIHISVAYFFSVDYVVDIVYVYPALVVIQKEFCVRTLILRCDIYVCIGTNSNAIA